MEVGQDLELIWVNNMTKYIGQYSQKLKNIFIGKLSVWSRLLELDVVLLKNPQHLSISWSSMQASLLSTSYNLQDNMEQSHLKIIIEQE